MKTSRFACLSVLLPLVAGAATISDVSFRQDRATRVVTVNYALSNGGNPAYVTMEVLDGDGIAIASANLNIKTATGDISQIDGHAVPDDGTTKTITWPVMADWPDHLMTNASVRISAHSVDNPPPKFEYIYIDLSAGPDAASYPVVATFDVPDPTDITCVSNRLWMRRIEAGTFKQGSPSTEAGRNSNRESQHQVTLTKPFYAGVFEVTRAQYRLVLGDASETSSGSALRPLNGKKLNELWGEGFDPSASNDVVETSFFYALRQKTGLLFTLPTDAQWEYACRAGTVTPYNVDTNFLALTDVAWYTANASSSTHPVGQKAPNAWGLYDMHGNVFELCRDGFVHNLGTSSVTDPLRGRSGSAGLGHVIRGGSYVMAPQMIRSPYRGWRAMDGSSPSEDGIRVFLTLE